MNISGSILYGIVINVLLGSQYVKSGNVSHKSPMNCWNRLANRRPATDNMILLESAGKRAGLKFDEERSDV